MKDFMTIDGLGNLKIDVVLFESYYPILFTCINEKKELFLCVCCQSNSQSRKWMITKTTPKVVIEMLNNKIMLRKAFLEFPKIQITVFEQGGIISIIKNDEAEWDYDSSKSLPDKDEYMDSEEGEFEEEISYYKSLMRVDYSSMSYVTEYKYSSTQLKKSYTLALDEVTIPEALTLDVDVNIGLRHSELLMNILKEYRRLYLYVEQYKKLNIRYDESYNKLERKIIKSSKITKKYVSTEITEGALDAA